MNFKDLDIKISYTSVGTDSIAKSFLVPALKCTKLYQRSVGFFSSGVFTPIIDGIVSLYRKQGKIQLIASPKLSDEDIKAIEYGYEQRENVVVNSFSNDFINEMDSLDDENLKMLAMLISNGTLDIKIAVTNTLGDYHDKLGIMEDDDGNTIVFYGSANSSINGYQENYEKIRVVRSWVSSDNASIEDEKSEFANLWNNSNPYVNVYEFGEAAKKDIFLILDHRESEKKANDNMPIKLRDYQEEAIAAWVNNNYHGFFVMATGTGKTWTAIFAAKELLKEHKSDIIICAPYKHLVKQWEEDVKKVFPKAKIVMVSSENVHWEQSIIQEIIRKDYYPDTQLIIISTIASFKMERFTRCISRSKSDKLLIVDEAHRFTDHPDELKQQYKYMLGLSATPYSGSSAQRGYELMSFFGGQVFSLPIETALERKFLVPYYYHPIYVNATEEEEQKFKNYTQMILQCFKHNVCINPELLAKSLRNRLRVISMADEKNQKLDEIIGKLNETDHVVVYCGDGKLYDNDTKEELRHIQIVKKALSQHEYKASQFTCTENIKDRLELVDLFNKGGVTALAAIRCLDEGINIPSIKSALILSSNDDYREFVQRRGRILRLYKGKEFAHIYDVIVLPSSDHQTWAKIELRRFREYAHLAKNYGELRPQLNQLLSEFGLCEDDVCVYDYDDMEVVDDE